MQKIAIGSDHAGYEKKALIIKHLKHLGYEVKDFGTYSVDSTDYPDYAHPVAKSIENGTHDLGVLFCGSANGVSMVANKHKNVRVALSWIPEVAKLGREHNDANVLTLGAGLIGSSLATQIVDVWLATECTEPRHRQRVAMFADSGAHAGGPVAGLNLSDQDIDRVVTRLHEILGPMATAEPGGPCVGDNPDMAREFVRLGATGLTSVSPAEQPGSIPGDLARYIDHTLLKPDATEEKIRSLCAEALEFNFRSVCVNPTWVPLAAELLRGSDVLTCTVVGFPLGANEPAIKAMEARRAIRNGAREIDMVINIGALKSGNDEQVLRDIRAVVEDCVDGNAVCKVILETALLTDAEKRRASELARSARAHFVKTSTGFSTGGATVSDVALMAEVVRGAGMEVKASGGISSYDDAKAMIEAGATRLGASASIGIVQEAKSTSMSA